jgi:peroxiredoxin
MRSPNATVVLAAYLFATACSRDQPSKPATLASAPYSPLATAELARPAPDFTLKDIDGRDVHLADYLGKVVVLEWFNPKCPFVNASHTKGSLKDDASRQIAQGVVWLGVDSAAPGKQGYAVEDIRDAVKRFGLTHPILRDESGEVGHAYGATNTPHMFIIDRRGVLVYMGAIDNSPDGEGQSPQGNALVNFVDAAIADLSAGRAVRMPRTNAYGCSVKYGS